MQLKFINASFLLSAPLSAVLVLLPRCSVVSFWREVRIPQSGAFRSFHRNVMLRVSSSPPFTIDRVIFACLLNIPHLDLHMIAWAQIYYILVLLSPC